MRTIVRGKNLEVPDRVRQYAERKFARLERLLDDRTDAIVELSNEAHRSASDAHIADVTLVIDGRTLRSRAAGASYQAALDTVVDKVERQAIDYKEKPRVRSRPMEDLGHDFYVFVNAENERLSVLYLRKDGHYGLIEPVVGGEYTPDRKGATKAGTRSGGKNGRH